MAANTGAVDHVIPVGALCVPDGVVELYFVGANDAHIEAYGGYDSRMSTSKGPMACKYQVANVARTLRSCQQDDRPCFYLYRQVMGPHSQTGLVAAASCQEYLDGIIKKHELTRPDKEDDRVRHIEALDSQTGPVFLTYRADAAMDAFVAARCTAAPAVDLTAPDGVRHTAWVVGDAEGIATLAAAFEKMRTAPLEAW